MIDTGNLVGDQLHRHQGEENEDTADGGDEVERAMKQVAADDPISQGQNEQRRECIPSARRCQANSGEYS